jgi:8-oxo-dGTP pyrophosphatase MutT (NUDIX family)
MEPFQVREVFHGSFLRVDVESWPAGEREVVRHPGASAVVAFVEGDDVLLVRQPREAVRQVLLEVPAGVLVVPGEDATTCAVRELMEETGHRVTRIESLGAIYSSPGFADERIELFLAQAEPSGTDAAEPGIEVVRMPFGEALRAVREGEIEDAKTVAALLLANERRAVSLR